jgi:hypothetical protein
MLVHGFLLLLFFIIYAGRVKVQEQWTSFFFHASVINSYIQAVP